MTDCEAMQMALAKLEHLWEIGIDAEYKVELLPEIRVLRQALAQGEQEPVAWMQDSVELYVNDCPTESYTIPLYTAPPKREWVGLTDDEIKKIMQRWRNGYIDIKDVEQLLKDKNI